MVRHQEVEFFINLLLFGSVTLQDTQNMRCVKIFCIEQSSLVHSSFFIVLNFKYNKLDIK